MIKEDDLFDGTGIEFTIFAKHQIHVRLAVGLAGGVQTVHVRFILHAARDGVGQWGHKEEVEGEDDHRQRQHCDVGDPANIPLRSPARESGADAPIQERKADHDHDPNHD